MNEERYSKNLARMIKEAKDRSGYTISYIAERLNRNDKTISNWISGKASPTVPALFNLFEVLEQPIFKNLVTLKHPNAESDASEKRSVLIDYIQAVASNEEIEKLYFVMFGKHGSSWIAQLEEFTALDHLPLRDRFLIAYIIANSYQLAEDKNEITDSEVVPDLSLVYDGISKGKEAILNGLNYYK